MTKYIPQWQILLPSSTNIRSIDFFKLVLEFCNDEFYYIIHFWSNKYYESVVVFFKKNYILKMYFKIHITYIFQSMYI